MIEHLVNSDLINLNFSVDNVDELFEKVAEILSSKEFVKSSYIDALKKREEEFPTGLKTAFLNIALPHSDSMHIKQPFIFIARNDKELIVNQMGDNSEMLCKDFIFLGIKDSTKQVGLLSTLMELFMDETFVNKYINCKDLNEMYSLFSK